MTATAKANLTNAGAVTTTALPPPPAATPAAVPCPRAATASDATGLAPRPLAARSAAADPSAIAPSAAAAAAAAAAADPWATCTVAAVRKASRHRWPHTRLGVWPRRHRA